MSKIAIAAVLLFASPFSSLIALADPKPIPPLRVAVEVPGQDQLRFGTLSFAAEGLKFDSDELLFTVPAKDLEDIQVAGFRERFLTLVVRKDSGFSRTYAFLFAERRMGMANVFSLSFQLGPKEVLRAALEAGTKYREQIADQLRANVAAPAPAGASSSDVIRAIGPSPGIIGAPAVLGNPPPPTFPRDSEDPKHGAAASSLPQAAKEMFRISARYLEKRKGVSSLILLGTSGELVFFDDTIGFRSQNQNPHLGPNKAPFLEDGYLKFRIHDKDIQTATYHAADASNATLTLAINRRSPFFAEEKALFTESKNDNEIVFLISAASQYQLSNYLQNRIGSGF